jgi:Ca2+-binding EF-hand superfamily protein
MSSNAFQLADNNLVNEADDYIKKNRLVELFEDLATAVAYRQPENLKEFLIERLENKKEQGLRGGIFTEEEARNVFKLFDLKQEKKISKERCIKGLQTMANSSFQYEIPEASEEIPLEVDEDKFVELCQKFLGFASKEM